MKRCFLFALLLTSAVQVSGCGDKKNPVDPNPPQSAQTRVIQLTGNLAFGNTEIGQSFSAVLKIENKGNSTLTITGMTVTGGMSTVIASTWTSGSISAGASHEATIKFTPTVAQSYSGTISVNGDQTSGTNTIATSGTGTSPPPPPGPRTTFGAGQWLVNTDIAAGRYFAAPPNTGCYWERQKGLSGTFDDIIANDVFVFKPPQIIVDVLSSDKAFQPDSDCGTWNQSPKRGLQSTVTPGAWLIGSQVNAGLYKNTVGAGCYWERLRDFTGNFDAIIANGFISTSQQAFLEPRSSDVGIWSDDDCGTWSPTSTVASLRSIDHEQSRDEIAANLAAYRRKIGR